jgi:hypothetical protein
MKEERNKEENPNEVANKILREHLEGKSFGFVKIVCENVLSVFDKSTLTSIEVENYTTTSEKLLESRRLVQNYLKA